MRIMSFEVYEEPLDLLSIRWDIERCLPTLESTILIEYAEGYTMKQIATRHQLPLHRVRQILRDAIQHARQLFGVP